MRKSELFTVCGLAGVLLLGGCGSEAEPSSGSAAGAGEGGAASRRTITGDWREAAREAVGRGASFLLAQAKDGRWSVAPGQPADPGITGLCALALLQAPGAEHRAAARPALEWLATLQKPDGAIYEDKLKTYCTAVAVLAFKASGDSRWAPQVERAVGFLKTVQIDGGEGVDESSEDFGGVGYGGSGRTNMSTTQWAIEAVSAAGLDKDDAFYQKALKFLERSQNRSESNTMTHVVDGQKVESGNDGGGLYGPSQSKAGVAVLPDGRRILRSYGSMSYALLKSYMLCELESRDPRVRAVVGWLEKNFELGHNPGMEHVEGDGARFMGLYYYYLTLGRTLEAAKGRGVVVEGALSAWREKLAREVVGRQRDDGSWLNEQDRWWEGSPSLVTAYALLALEEALRSAR